MSDLNLLSQVWLTIENPSHLEDDDIVEEKWIIVSEERNQILDKFHVQIAQASASHFKED